MARQETDPSDFVRRYEALKKQWFAAAKKQYDDDGSEIPSAMDRGVLAQMFEKMGVEIPIHPNDPPRLTGQQSPES
jgi:hypothetical protein